jgi:hypothetical protein
MSESDAWFIFGCVMFVGFFLWRIAVHLSELSKTCYLIALELKYFNKKADEIQAKEMEQRYET